MASRQYRFGYAHAIKIDAQAMMRKFVKEGPKATGKKSKICGTRKEPPNAPPTLKDLKISKKESVASQLLHTIKEEQPKEVESIPALVCFEWRPEAGSDRIRL